MSEIGNGKVIIVFGCIYSFKDLICFLLMSSKEISQKDAENMLEKTVQNFDWLREFFGAERESFLVKYRALHAQLREGDELKIEIRRVSHETSRNDYDCPVFQIVLYEKGKERKTIHSRNTRGYGFSRDGISEGLLYVG